jgi:hypothetical protein
VGLNTRMITVDSLAAAQHIHSIPGQAHAGTMNANDDDAGRSVLAPGTRFAARSGTHR